MAMDKKINMAVKMLKDFRKDYDHVLGNDDLDRIDDIIYVLKH